MSGQVVKAWLYGILALAVMGALGGIAHGIYKAGVNAEKAQQAVRDKRAAEQERKARLAREADASDATKELLASQDRARDADARWRAARAAAGRKPVAVGSCSGSPGIPDRPDVGASGSVLSQLGAEDPPIRFTPIGLGLWDSAWTGGQGQPIFGDPGDIASGAAKTAAPLPSLDAALDNHAENAQRCSENARQLSSLIGLVRKLQGARK